MGKPRINEKRTDRKKRWKKDQSSALRRTLELVRIPAGFQVDHIVPKEWCFNHGISPQRCASLGNIQFLTPDENHEKGTRLTDESWDVIHRWERDDRRI